jgi:hypothetical protein
MAPPAEGRPARPPMMALMPLIVSTGCLMAPLIDLADAEHEAEIYELSNSNSSSRPTPIGSNVNRAVVSDMFTGTFYAAYALFRQRVLLSRSPSFHSVSMPRLCMIPAGRRIWRPSLAQSVGSSSMLLPAAITLLLFASVLFGCARPANVSRDTQPVSGASSLVGTASAALSVEEPETSRSLPASQQEASLPTSHSYDAVGPDPSAPSEYASFDNFVGCLTAETVGCNCAGLSEREQAAVSEAYPDRGCQQVAADPLP